MTLFLPGIILISPRQGRWAAIQRQRLKQGRDARRKEAVPGSSGQPQDSVCLEKDLENGSLNKNSQVKLVIKPGVLTQHSGGGMGRSGVRDQPGIHSEILSWKKKAEIKRKKNVNG